MSALFLRKPREIISSLKDDSLPSVNMSKQDSVQAESIYAVRSGRDFDVYVIEAILPAHSKKVAENIICLGTFDANQVQKLRFKAASDILCLASRFGDDAYSATCAPTVAVRRAFYNRDVTAYFSQQPS